MSPSLSQIISAHWAEAAMSLTLAGLITRGLTLNWAYAVVALLLIGLPLVPIGPNYLSIAAIAASVLGEISSLSLLLIVASFLPRWQLPRSRRLLLLPILTGLALYWSVLSYAPIDLYRLGYLHAAYGKLGLFAMLGALALLCLVLPLRVAILIALACLSWSLGLQGSTNLWDYLLDFPSVLFYLGLLLATLKNRGRP